MQFRTRLKNNIRRPIIPVRVHINGLSVLTDALIDTGADVTILPKFVADRLGIDLSTAPELSLIGALGGGGSYRVVELELELRELPNSIRWKAQVGFTDREMSFAFLGTRGFFEFFELTYNAKRELIDLTFNDANSDGYQPNNIASQAGSYSDDPTLAEINRNAYTARDLESDCLPRDE